VNLSETCQAGAYNTTDLQQLVTRLVGQEAATRFGSGYGLTGDMSITLASTVITPTSQQIATISVNAVSQWVYQVGKSQQQQISHQIAGKSKHDALFMLSHLDGIRGASVNLVGGYNDLLPQDADRIQIVVMYRFV
jgi:VCBS repeat-containing protein